MTDVDTYCRDLEAYLCRKNDGHLIRISGPAFDRVMGWAKQGIPMKVAEAGIDRYFERYYRKGTRRRPVRIEFCEADILDAFDGWRRAVGVARVVPQSSNLAQAEDHVPGSGRPRQSLAAHLDAVLSRLTVLRGSDKAGPALGEALDSAVRAIDAVRGQAARARGQAREALLDRLTEIDRALVSAAFSALDAPTRQALTLEADRELEAFRRRMTADAFAQSQRAACARLVRHHFSLPEIERVG